LDDRKNNWPVKTCQIFQRFSSGTTGEETKEIWMTQVHREYGYSNGDDGSCTDYAKPNETEITHSPYFPGLL